MQSFAPYLLLLLPIAAGFILLFAARGRKRPADAAPVCRKCGYDVRGLPGNICPECGSDLKVVGVLRGGERVPLGAWGRVLTWTAFVFLSVYLPAALWNEAEQHWLIMYDVSRSKSFASPRSGAYREIHWSYHVRSYGAASRPEPPPQRMTLTLTSNNGAVRVTEVMAREVSDESLANWMTRAHIPADNPAVRRERAEILTQLRRTFNRPADSSYTSVTAGGPFGGAGATSNSQMYRAPWSNHIPFAAAVTIWAIGIPFRLRGRRERPQ